MKNVWSLFEVFSNNGLTTSVTFNSVCTVFFSCSTLIGFGLLYKNRSDVGDLKARLDKLSENQESMKLLLKAILEQNGLCAEGFGELLELSGGLVEQTAGIFRSLDVISLRGGELDEELIQTRRRLSSIRSTLGVCVEEQKAISNAIIGPFNPEPE
jgi:hypothetical protein